MSTHTIICGLVEQRLHIGGEPTAESCVHAGGLRIVFEAQGYSPEMLSVYVLATSDVVWVGSTDHEMAGLETIVQGNSVRKLTFEWL